jgi:hypothetical protein
MTKKQLVALLVDMKALRFNALSPFRRNLDGTAKFTAVRIRSASSPMSCQPSLMIMLDDDHPHDVRMAGFRNIRGHSN